MKKILALLVLCSVYNLHSMVGPRKDIGDFMRFSYRWSPGAMALERELQREIKLQKADRKRVAWAKRQEQAKLTVERLKKEQEEAALALDREKAKAFLQEFNYTKGLNKHKKRLLTDSTYKAFQKENTLLLDIKS